MPGSPQMTSTNPGPPPLFLAALRTTPAACRPPKSGCCQIRRNHLQRFGKQDMLCKTLVRYSTWITGSVFAVSLPEQLPAVGKKLYIYRKKTGKHGFTPGFLL